MHKIMALQVESFTSCSHHQQKEDKMWSRWLWLWHGCWTGFSISEMICLLGSSVSGVTTEWKANDILWVSVLRCETACWWERSERNGQSGSSWPQVSKAVRQMSTLYIRGEKKSISEQTSKVDGLQEQKTTSCTAQVSQEQKSEALNLDGWRNTSPGIHECVCR